MQKPLSQIQFPRNNFQLPRRQNVMFVVRANSTDNYWTQITGMYNSVFFESQRCIINVTIN